MRNDDSGAWPTMMMTPTKGNTETVDFSAGEEPSAQRSGLEVLLLPEAGFVLEALKKVPDSSVIAGKSVEKPNPIQREDPKKLKLNPLQNEKSLEETKPKGPKLEGRV